MCITLKPVVQMSEYDGWKYTVEYAKTGRSKCKVLGWLVPRVVRAVCRRLVKSRSQRKSHGTLPEGRSSRIRAAPFNNNCYADSLFHSLFYSLAAFGGIREAAANQMLRKGGVLL